MSTTLTQSASASFSDRPNTSGVGLHVSMSIGDEGALLSHDLGSEYEAIYIRFVFNPWAVSGGRFVPLAGLDGQGNVAMRMTFDAGTRGLVAWLPGGSLSAVLDGVLPWQCIELGIDTVSGEATLWVNGVVADQSSGDHSASTIQTVCFGAIHKQTAVTGDVYMDELSIADDYIGPVVTPPTLPYAGDSARWLVVYNTAEPDAVSWANTYRQARGVPYANLAGLTLPTTETINAGQYAALVDAVEAYLTDNHLAAQIMGVLLGYGVPGYVDFTGSGPLEAVPALTQTAATTAGTSPNTNATPTPSQRLTFDDLAGGRMTARMDARDIASANTIISRADTVIASSLTGSDSTIYFDPFAGNEPTYQDAFDDMIAWATGLRGMKTRLPIVFSGDPAGNAEASFDAVINDGLFVGWSSTLPDPDIFSNPAGRRALCVQLFLEGATATSLRNEVPDNWADTPINAGYAAAIVSSRDNPVSAIPHVGALFDALREGWTLGESFHVAQPMLRSGFYLVGDPLMGIAMPRRGYEVFGPLDSLEHLDPASPLAVLSEDAAEFDVSNNLPAEFVESHYVIRRSDAQGRAEASYPSVRVMNIGGVAYQPVTLPVWPDITDWPVLQESGRVLLLAVWAEPIGGTHIQAIELLAQPDGQAFSVVATPSFSPRDTWLSISLPMPTVKTRYRWRFTSADGVVQHTDYSAWVEPLPAPAIALQPIGGAA